MVPYVACVSYWSSSTTAKEESLNWDANSKKSVWSQEADSLGEMRRKEAFEGESIQLYKVTVILLNLGVLVLKHLCLES